MRRPLDWSALDAYLSEEVSPDEHAAVRAWASSDARRTTLLAALHHKSDALGRPEVYWDTDRMWQRFVANQHCPEQERRVNAEPANAVAQVTVPITDTSRGVLNTMTSPRMARRNPNILQRWTSRRIGVFASVMLAVLLGLGYTGLRGWMSGQHPTGYASTWDIVTTRGQRSSVMLIDGSRVEVAPESRVTIPKGFGERTRELAVDGEAYFVVAPDSKRPFVVQAGRVATRVLGTAFSVRKYAGDTAVRVAVVDGKVAVGETVVSAGDVAITANRGRTTVSASSDLTPYVGWVSGRLVFVDEQFSDVITALSRAYDIQIELRTPSLASHRLTAVFDNQPLRDVLRDLALAVNATVEQHSNRVVFTVRER